MTKIKIGQIWTPKSKDKPNVIVVEILENVVAVTHVISKTFITYKELNWMEKDWLLEDWELKK